MNPPAVLLIVGHARGPGRVVDALSARLSSDQVTVFDDGVAALGFLSTCPPKEAPRLALLYAGHDQCLETLRAFRATPRGQLIPIVVLLIDATDADIRAATALGANSCLRAPNDPEKIELAVDQLARYWLELNIPPPILA